MLLDAKLTKKYWAESVSTAVYLRNHCPTKALMDKTPYEAWFEQKPTVDHLRVFGCDAYVNIPKDEQRKLDSKAKKCVFLGHGDTTKGYRLYDPEKGKVIYSRDVRFDEGGKPGSSIDNNSTTRRSDDADKLFNPTHVVIM